MSDNRIIQDLDIHLIFEELCRCIQTPYARDVLMNTCSSGVEEARILLAETEEALDFLKSQGDLGLDDIPDVHETLARINAGVLPEPVELVSIARFVEKVADCRNRLLKGAGEIITSWARNVSPPVGIIWEIEGKITEEGKVKENASQKLRTLLRDKITTRAKLVDAMEGLMEKYRDFLQDDYWTLRNGRAVLPVKIEWGSKVKGIILGTSQTERTVYVEPQEVIGLNNQMMNIESGIESEIYRILRDLTETVRGVSSELEKCMRFVGEVDAVFARARLAKKWRASRPEFSDYMKVEAMRSPQLLAMGKDPVPSSIELKENKAALYIIGPNAGGKTVLLKALGACMWMASRGLFVPSRDNVFLRYYRHIFTLIGDYQDISQGLSSFSGRMAVLSRILHEARDGDLVLLDEPFAGTSLREALALERAVMEVLVERGVDVVVTSNLIEGVFTAAEYPWCEWGSMGYSSEKSGPTYRFQPRVLEFTHGIDIARRTGFPPEVVDRAHQYLDAEFAHLTALIENAEKDRDEIAKLKKTLTEELTRVEAEKKKLEKERKRFREELRARMRRAVDEVIRKGVEEIEKLKKEKKPSVKAIERTLTRVRKEAEAVVDPGSFPVPEVGVGQDVKMKITGDVGKIIEVHRDGTVTVEIRGIKWRVDTGEVVPVERAQVADPVQVFSDVPVRLVDDISFPVMTAENTCYIRKMRVEDALEKVNVFMDTALLKNLNYVYIVHGKGEGVLKRALMKHLRGFPYVEEVRSGLPHEGGDGVTVVKLRR